MLLSQTFHNILYPILSIQWLSELWCIQISPPRPVLTGFCICSCNAEAAALKASVGAAGVTKRIHSASSARYSKGKGKGVRFIMRFHKSTMPSPKKWMKMKQKMNMIVVTYLCPLYILETTSYTKMDHFFLFLVVVLSRKSCLLEKNVLNSSSLSKSKRE